MANSDNHTPEYRSLAHDTSISNLETTSSIHIPAFTVTHVKQISPRQDRCAIENVVNSKGIELVHFFAKKDATDRIVRELVAHSISPSDAHSSPPWNIGGTWDTTRLILAHALISFPYVSSFLLASNLTESSFCSYVVGSALRHLFEQRFYLLLPLKDIVDQYMENAYTTPDSEGYHEFNPSHWPAH